MEIYGEPIHFCLSKVSLHDNDYTVLIFYHFTHPIFTTANCFHLVSSGTLTIPPLQKLSVVLC